MQASTVTQALLFLDFDIQLDIPNHRLYPPVPNRWVEIACLKVQYLICGLNLDSITSSGCMTSFLTRPHKNDRPLLSVALTCTLQLFFTMSHGDHVSYPPAGQAPPPSTHYLPAASRQIGASLQLVSLVSLSTLLISFIRMARCRYRVACVRSGKYRPKQPFRTNQRPAC